MRWPKLRELKEAVNAVFSPRFTTRFPAVPCEVPERFRGKPEFDLDTCIGCGACVNVCPTASCLKMVDDLEADPPVRRITHRYDTCIFCGNIGTKKHLRWLCDKLGPLAYTNPSLLLARSGQLTCETPDVEASTDAEIRTRDFMRILCPQCKCELNVRL